MKRFISLVLTIAILVIILPNITGVATSPNWQDSGVPIAVSPNNEGVFEISAPEQLAWIAQKVNAGTDSSTFSGYTVKLMNDIDLSGREWTPIGAWIGYKLPTTKAFAGIFDGNGKKVCGVSIGSASAINSDYYKAGFFGYNIGTIQNVGIENVSIYSDTWVGGLVGEQDAGTISNSYVTGSVTGGNSSKVGGLVGELGSSATITSSYATATVAGGSSLSYVGGLVGYQRGNMTNSYATGNVTGAGSFYVGGLVGLQHGDITNSYATGNVTGAGSCYVGGLVGLLSGGTITTISNSYATGNVTGAYYVGGLVGGQDGIVTADAIGNLTGGSSSDLGGLSDVFCGTISNSYWNKDAIHKIGSTVIQSINKKGVGSGTAATIGKTISELKQQSTFWGWDFTSTWAIDSSSVINNGLPYLLSNIPPPSEPTYSVTYNANGSTGGTAPVDNSSYLEGATITVAGNTGNLVKTGYTFSGWNTKADGSGINYVSCIGTFTMGSANVILYAKWTIDNTTIIYGDVNADGLINISDVVIVAEIAIGNTNYTSEQIIRANVSSKEDMTVDISDAILIAERAVGGTTLFPVER